MFAASLVAGLLLTAQTAVVEVPFRIAEDALVVDATINGSKVSLIFDTGFGGEALVSDAVDIGPVDGTAMLRDFVGEFSSKTVKIKSFKLGTMTLDPTGMRAIQRSTAGMSFGYNMHTDGLIGLGAIKNYVTEFDFEHQKLIFHPKSVDITKRTPDNKRTFLAKLLPIGNTSMQMLVTTPSGRTMVMGLDTGNAFYATTHKDVLERVGLWTSERSAQYMHMSGIASGTVDSWYLKMPPLKVFGIPVQNSVWSIIDLPSGTADTDGTVGFGFLKNFNFTVDLDRRRVWLDNFTGSAGNEPVAEVGLAGGFRDRTRRVEIWNVTPGSPAHVAGIKRGDEVISVDDQGVTSTSFRRFDSMMVGPEGSTVKIAISRKGELMRFELKRVYLINEVATKTGPPSLISK
jgi:hypothetical protein